MCRSWSGLTLLCIRKDSADEKWKDQLKEQLSHKKKRQSMHPGADQGLQVAAVMKKRYERFGAVFFVAKVE